MHKISNQSVSVMQEDIKGLKARRYEFYRQPVVLQTQRVFNECAPTDFGNCFNCNLSKNKIKFIKAAE